MSDTPRTNALHRRLVKLSEGPSWIAGRDYIDMKTHAEKLERENAALREQLEAVRRGRDGCVMVPAEPTPEMLQAWHDREIEGADYIDRNSIVYALYVACYKAMLAAAIAQGKP